MREVFSRPSREQLEDNRGQLEGNEGQVKRRGSTVSSLRNALPIWAQEAMEEASQIEERRLRFANDFCSISVV